MNDRMRLIEEISEVRESSIICYVSGDRQNISTRIAPDIIPVFYKHLQALPAKDKIDLFLFTKGGDVHTAIRLVELIYEFIKNFSVLIPFKAYSAGTLLALGASEIVMTKMGELSPVDPNITSMFNPQDPRNPVAKLPVNVEDVHAFFSVTKDLGIKNEAAMVEILSRLLENVHPLALGSLYRSSSLIRAIAKKLLLNHIDSSQTDRISTIVDNLTRKFYSHSYMISRKEAAENIKLPVTYCPEELETKLMQLYEIYERDLYLDIPFVPELNSDDQGRFNVSSGIIESSTRTDEYIFEGMVDRLGNVDMSGNVNIISQGWKRVQGGQAFE